MTTALDIITGGAKLLGVVFKSEALSADEASDGLVVLNDMLDSWSNENLLTYAYTIESFPLTGAASYTIGAGGNFNTSRPINIATAVVRAGGVDYPLKIISPEQYQQEIAVKSISSQIPQYLTYENGYPLAAIKMYYVPVSGSTLYLQSNKPLTNLSALTSVVTLPPGWNRALKYNVAIDLAAQYGVDVPAAVAEVARKSKGAIMRSTAVNTPLALRSSDIGGKPYVISGGF